MLRSGVWLSGTAVTKLGALDSHPHTTRNEQKKEGKKGGTEGGMGTGQRRGIRGEIFMTFKGRRLCFNV